MSSMIRVLSFLFISLLCTTVFSQGLNPQFYKYGASPSSLPSYLLQPSKSQNFIIGISNPDMDSLSAINQALNRAKGLLYLSYSASVNSVTDYFTGEESTSYSGTFQTFLQMQLKDSVFYDFIILDTFFTKFNEAIIRIAPDEDIPLTDFPMGRSYHISLERYAMEYEYDGAAEFGKQTNLYFEYQDSLSTSKDSVVFYENSYQTGIECYLDDLKVSSPLLRYNYIDEQVSGQQYFKHGLWVHLMSKIMQKAAFESKKERENIKKTQEIYINNIQLNQGISGNILTFKINDITLTEGNVEIVMDINFLKF